MEIRRSITAAMRDTCFMNEAALIRIARESVRAEVRGEAPPRVPAKSPPRPVFVTIERKGRVIGCRGTLVSRAASLEEEVALAARAAAAHDPRYRPLTPDDLLDFLVTVTVISDLRPLSGIETLTPDAGLVLRASGRTGVVLPWEGRDPRIRLEWAYRKAGVTPGASCTLQKMLAERFRG